MISDFELLLYFNTLNEQNKKLTTQCPISYKCIRSWNLRTTSVFSVFSIYLFNSFQFAFGPQSSPDTSFTRVNKSLTYCCTFFSTYTINGGSGVKHRILHSSAKHNTWSSCRVMPSPSIVSFSTSAMTSRFLVFRHVSGGLSLGKALCQGCQDELDMTPAREEITV